MCTIIKKIHEIRRRLADDPCIAVVEEEPRGLRGVVADELEVAVAETAGPNAEGEAEGDVATHLGTARPSVARGGRRLAMDGNESDMLPSMCWR